jgi:hypothetical protein
MGGGAVLVHVSPWRGESGHLRLLLAALLPLRQSLVLADRHDALRFVKWVETRARLVIMGLFNLVKESAKERVLKHRHVRVPPVQQCV